MSRLRVSDIALGCAAGVAGTLAMDTLWWWRARRSGSEDGFAAWEFATRNNYETFSAAGAPAQVGQRLARLVGIELPVEKAGLTADIVHWSTAVSWGAASGVVAAITPLGAIPAGAVGGVGAVTGAYAGLGALGIYEPIWKYERQTLWKDMSAHLLFGTTTGLAMWSMRKLASTFSPSPR